MDSAELPAPSPTLLKGAVMTLTVPPLCKQPDLKSALGLRRSRPRTSGIFACMALLSSTLLMSVPFNAHSQERRAAETTPRAEASKAQFYEVFGKRYRVRESSDGYRETGIASWYGRPFHGRPTSSGEKYDMNEMTAAHTTLPLPTWVEVTNLASGKRIVVKINDRGPFVGKRMIDLSYAAATALDIVQSGTAQVEVRALDGPPPQLAARPQNDRRPTPDFVDERVAAAEVVDVPAPVPQRLFAEAGRFTQRSEAVEVVNALRAEGFVNAFVVTEDGRRKSLHRVRVGPLSDATEVERMSSELRGVGARRSRSVVMP